MVLQRYFQWQWLMAVAMLAGFSLPLQPVWAAERVYVSFSLVERSIPVRDLENFVNEGKISPKLSAYTRYLNEAQLNRFKESLEKPIDVTPLGIAQFLYSPQGEVLLQRLGRVVKTGGRQQGFYAIRAALILAAAEPEGMTLLNIMKKFPTQGLRIDLGSALDIALDLYTLVRQTHEAHEVVTQQSAIEVAFQSQVATVPEGIQWNSAFPFSVPEGEIPVSELPDLFTPGYFPWKKSSFMLQDRERNRTYPVDLYLPNPSDQPAPLVVISHGLGSNRETFVYLATHLASRGFAVAVPEHLESSDRQREAMLQGKANEVAEPSEFINRPLDITFMLDELSRQIQPGGPLEGRVNLDRVGAIGQSFGGYTVLALAGAEINFDQLQEDCNPGSPSWNVSLLLQCRALELGDGDRTLNLQDSRIQSIIAINPISSRVLGESSLNKVNIPAMIVAGSKDTIAPSFPEQILPFVWLTHSPEKYLVLQEGGTHFSTLQSGEDDLALPSLVIGEDPDLARLYTLELGLAFFQTYVAQNPEYKPYLTPAYIQSISQDPMPMSLVTQLELEQLPQISPGF
ncbi:alpha/beta hydrolase [Roseofilum capinflatum]|uniref:Alpha/beta hydrolase n=1 Tax=Roseofilum capinflatum BLCC-M114 TaxID=3022440 RepID=A0ABT7B9B1_9CYAN|nr:alpha/beta hydrolase [Roseofilum capinflatum]MDJ1175751.1 alpha/beta hydrolase [Roseofilum capinflatum BLCC-M114]